MIDKHVWGNVVYFLLRLYPSNHVRFTFEVLLFRGEPDLHRSLSKKLTIPGFEPGLSRPQRDVLTARRYGRYPRMLDDFFDPTVCKFMKFICKAYRSTITHDCEIRTQHMRKLTVSRNITHDCDKKSSTNLNEMSQSNVSRIH